MNGSGNLKSGRIALRRWRESDVDALFALASEPVVGEMAKFPVHADRAESLRVIHEIPPWGLCGRGPAVCGASLTHQNALIQICASVVNLW